MTPGVLATRNAHALNRTMAAAQILAERFSLPLGELHPSARDPQAAALFQREAVADLLEALVNATERTVEGLAQSFIAAGQALASEQPSISEADPAELTVPELAKLVAEMDAEALDALEAAEQGGKQRKGVQDAIDDRRTALAEEAEAESSELETDAEGRPVPEGEA